MAGTRNTQQARELRENTHKFNQKRWPGRPLGTFSYR